MSSQRPVQNRPSGTENYDNEALNDNQQIKTNYKKIDLRIENEKYLREHPEVTVLIQDFLRESYLNKPNDVKEFAADPNLIDRLNNLLQQRERKYEVNKLVQKMKTQDLNRR